MPRWPASSCSSGWRRFPRSEEHTSELQSQSNLVCRLLLEKKNRPINTYKMTPKADARRVNLLSAQSAAFSSRLRLRSIILGPIDASLLSLAHPANTRQFSQ